MFHANLVHERIQNAIDEGSQSQMVARARRDKFHKNRWSLKQFGQLPVYAKTPRMIFHHLFALPGHKNQPLY